MEINDAVDISLKNILFEGLNDTFPTPFEVGHLKNADFKAAVKNEVEKCIKGSTLQSLKMHPIQHVLLPKKDPFDFRRCALIDPMDYIKYLSISLMMADKIEPKRVAHDTNRVLSYRLKLDDNGSIFDPKYTITYFRNITQDRVKEKQVSVLVKADINNFYDRINLHRLESVLRSIGIESKSVKLLNELLLFWSNRDSYGLPVGSNASRILAEVSLMEVDNFLLSHKVDFIRFVDDYRFFAPNAKTAHYWIRLLIERLSLEGLSINTKKTTIKDVSTKSHNHLELDEINEISFDNEFLPAKQVAATSTLENNGVTVENNRGAVTFTGVRYGGGIPTRFREASQDKVTKIKEVDTLIIKNEITKTELIEVDVFKKFIDSILYNEQYELLELIPELLDKSPQFTPYVVDMLIKKESVIPKGIRDDLTNTFSEWLNSDEYPEYVLIELVKLLGSDGYLSKESILDFFRSLKRNAGAYIGRATLESLQNLISRGEVIEIRQYYDRADAWEKRQIISIAKQHIHEDEIRPWLKNVKIHNEGDMFSSATVDINAYKPKEKTPKKEPKEKNETPK